VIPVQQRAQFLTGKEVCGISKNALFINLLFTVEKATKGTEKHLSIIQNDATKKSNE
jgi:hypothetical protein